MRHVELDTWERMSVGEWRGFVAAMLLVIMVASTGSCVFSCVGAVYGQ